MGFEPWATKIKYVGELLCKNKNCDTNIEFIFYYGYVAHWHKYYTNYVN